MKSIDSGLCPGGLVFQAWLGDRLVLETCAKSRDDAFGQGLLDAHRTIDEMKKYPELDPELRVYDGDDGSLVFRWRALK